MRSGHRVQARGLYSPRSTSAFVAPAVSSCAASSMIDHPSSSGSVTVRSSNCTRPRRPGALIGAYGTTCFWPESAIAANHEAECAWRRKSSTTGFSPFVAVTSRSPSTITEKLRQFGGLFPSFAGRPGTTDNLDITQAQASQMIVECGARALFWPTKLGPRMVAVGAPRSAVAPQCQQSPSAAEHSAIIVDPQMRWRIVAPLSRMGNPLGGDPGLQSGEELRCAPVTATSMPLEISCSRGRTLSST